MRHTFRLPLAITALLLLPACSRPIAVESDPSAAFAVEVSNPLSETMIVYWAQGDDVRRELGRVAPGGRERFVVAGTTTPSVTILAESPAGRSARSQAIVLHPGETVPVRLAY